MTIVCPNENGTVCPLMEEAGAGIGIFLQYLLMALPTLLITLAIIGVIVGIIGALVYVIKKSVTSVKMR